MGHFFRTQEHLKAKSNAVRKTKVNENSKTTNCHVIHYYYHKNIDYRHYQLTEQQTR